MMNEQEVISAIVIFFFHFIGKSKTLLDFSVQELRTNSHKWVIASLTLHCKKKSVKFTVKKRQLWLSEFYRKKYGNNILGFTVLT